MSSRAISETLRVLAFSIVLLVLVSSVSALEWGFVSTSGTCEKCSRIVGSIPGASYVTEQYATGLFAPGSAHVTLCSYGGTGEAILQSDPFVYTSKDPVKVELWLPTFSGAETQLGVDNRLWKTVSGPVWWKSDSKCVKNLKTQPNRDPSSDGTPVFSTYEFPSSAWEDGKPHRLSLRIVKGDPDCHFMVAVRNVRVTSTPPKPTTTPTTGAGVKKPRHPPGQMVLYDFRF